MTTAPRNALKEVVKFAKKEYREKKPLNARVLRVKDKRIYSRGGPFPSISISKAQIPYYMVILEYKDEYRIYNFTKDGLLVNGENFEKTSKKMEQIEKSTRLEYAIRK